MSIPVIGVKQRPNTTQDRRHVVSALVAQIAEYNEVEEREQQKVHQVDVGKAIVYGLPAEWAQEVPSLQLTVNMFVDQLSLLLLVQSKGRHTVLSNHARLHDDVRVDRSIFHVLILIEFFVALIKETR